MKKLLQLSIIALTMNNLAAQVLESDNFNSYTQGNVGSTTDGTTPGQGGIYTFGGTNQDYQIVSIDAAHGNSLQITSDNGNTAASNRMSEKQGLGTAWNNRLTGNNIIRASFDFYTGPSVGSFSAYNYPQSTLSGDSGVIVGIYFNPSSRILNGYANLTNTTTGATQVFTIDIPFATNFQANTWISASYAYDGVNGVITYTVNGATLSNFYIPANFQITKNLQPVKHNLSLMPAPANTVSQTAAFDNITVEAASSVTLSSLEAASSDQEVVIYPNPADDHLKISTGSTIKNVEIVDLSGRKLNTIIKNNMVTTNHLASGNYMIIIETEKGKTTKKFIKK